MRSRTNLKTSLVAACLALSTGAAAAQSITAEPLRPVDPFDVGAVAPEDGALPETLWRESDAASARAAITRAPAPASSAAVARIVRRALLSGGSPPQGGAGDEALAALRLETAWRAGFAGGVADLAARTPDIESSEPLSRIKADAELAMGALDAACRTADRLKSGRDAPYWLRLRATCLVRADDPAADLTADLARAAGDDPAFEAALGLAAGDEIEAVAPDSLLLLGVALNSPVTIRLSMDALAPPRMAALTLGRGPDEVKPMLGREAALRGWIRASELAAIYRMVPAPDTGGVDGALLVASRAVDGARREALVFQAAEAAAGPEVRAAAVADALGAARSAGEYALAARLYRPIIADLPRTADHAMAFAEAAALAGDPALAVSWRRAATEPPPPPPQPAGAPPPDAGPVALTSAQPAFTPPPPRELARLNALIDLYPQVRGELAAERRREAGGPGAGFEALMLDAAAGEPLDAAGRAALLSGEPAPGDAGLALALAAASEAGADAETALLAAALLGEADLATASPALLYAAVRALAAAGLEASAAELAAAAILARRR